MRLVFGPVRGVTVPERGLSCLHHPWMVRQFYVHEAYPTTALAEIESNIFSAHVNR